MAALCPSRMGLPVLAGKPTDEEWRSFGCLKRAAIPAALATSKEDDLTSARAVTVETLEQVLAAFNRHDLDAIMAFFAEDAVFEAPRGADPGGTRYVGKAAVREGLAGRFHGIPDVRYAEDQHWVCESRGVSEWLLTGTTTAGERIDVRGCDLWEFRDGLIVRKDSFWKIVVP